MGCGGGEERGRVNPCVSHSGGLTAGPPRQVFVVGQVGRCGAGRPMGMYTFITRTLYPWSSFAFVK